MACFLYQTVLAEAHTKIMELCVHACMQAVIKEFLLKLKQYTRQKMSE
jgi:hypothetical protein